MSAISGLSTSGIGQWLRNVAQSQGSQATPQISSAGIATGLSNILSDISGSTQKSGGGHHHHGGAGKLHTEIQQAVTTALQSVKSNSTADPNKVVESAIAGVLKNVVSGSYAAKSQAANTDNPSTDASEAADSSDAAEQSFQSLLQSAGITPQQFQSDFLAAVKDAQNGTVNPGTAFQSFQTGTAVDVLA